MKKLMVAVSAIALGLYAHASAYNWELNMNTDAYDGMTWYVVDGSGAATLASMLAVDGNVDGFKSALVDMGDNVQTGTFQADWWGWQDGLMSSASGVDITGKAFAFIFEDAGMAADSKFYYTADFDTTAHQYEPGGKPAETLTFSADSFSSATIAAVPEPTSGLLLLLGVAGLALRRRRA